MKERKKYEQNIEPLKRIRMLCELYPKLTIFIVYTLLIILPLGYKFVTGNVLLQGDESYYHLNLAQSVTIHNWQYSPLFLAQKYLPLNALAFIPLVLGLITIYFIYLTTQKIGMSIYHTLIFLTLGIISPVFLYTFRTLSSWAIFLTVSSIGFYLLFTLSSVTAATKNSLNTKLRLALCFLFFLLASSIDGISTLLLLSILIVVFVQYRNEKSIIIAPKIVYTIIFCLIISFALHQYVLNQPLFIGPFIEQNVWNDLIADFGAAQGMSIFMFLLGIIGFILVRKQHILFYSSLLFLSSTFLMYSSNTSFFFSIGLWFIFLSSIALHYLIERTWTLPKLKQFTLLVIMLGLVFTSLTYSVRLSSRSPTLADVEVLGWIQENNPQDKIIFTSPSIGNYVSYYSSHPVVSTLQNAAELKGNLTQKIYTTQYITELFPLLDGYDISLVYITPEMRLTLPGDQNFLFLLKNERFKLVYSTKDTEMWQVTNRSSSEE